LTDRLHGERVADVDGLQEGHLVHRDGHAEPAGVLERGDPGRGVDELHDDPP
jgi:hypothetical protein